MPLSKLPECKLKLGEIKSGALGKITDVPGVKVGHALACEGDLRAGVTVVLPCSDNVYINKCCANTFFLKNVGKSVGFNLVRENGTIEAPIGLTSTDNISAVQEALSNYVSSQCKHDGLETGNINAVVCECVDNKSLGKSANLITEKHVLAAIDSASENFAEGNTGAGSSVITYGMPGGIGSASRVMQFDGRDYTVGVLTMPNYGVLNELIAVGRPIGEQLAEKIKVAGRAEAGSCVTILATDIPLTSRQLSRVLRRSSVAISRMGGATEWEAYLGFTTSNRALESKDSDFVTIRALNETCLDKVICATADAIEEAVLRSMLFAGNEVTSDGTVLHSLSELL